MTRLAERVLVALMIGCAFTLASAATAYLWSSPSTKPVLCGAEGENGDLFAVYDSLGSERLVRFRWIPVYAAPTAEGTISTTSQELLDSLRHDHHITGMGLFGWPFRCAYWATAFGGRRMSRLPEMNPFGTTAFGIDQNVKDRNGFEKIIPTAVIWRNMLGDVVVWGVLALVGRQGVSILVRHVRTRQRRCRSCGYPMAWATDGARCPECGVSPTAPPGPSL